jgi:hypothetical protein
MSTLKVSTIAPLGTDATKTITIGSAGDTAAGIFTNTPAFRARLSSDQSIPNNTQTKMVLDTEDWDTDNAFDSTTNYRFTVPANQAGKYMFTVSLTAENIDDNEFFSFNLYLNGSQQQLTGQAKQFSPGSNQTLRFTATGYISLSVGDYIEAFVSHNEGGSIDLRHDESSFGGYKLIGV